MTTTREACEAWAQNEGINSFHYQHCFDAWQAATSAERERCASMCEVNQVARAVNKGHFLVNWPIDSYGTHEGMTYAAAIRQGGDA